MQLQVPFLDLKIQYQSIKEEINPAIQNVLNDAAFVLGKAVYEFEQNFAKAHDVSFCSGVSSGTDGNHLALWALGIGPGDEVIIPVNTFIATAWGATLCGATPVFVDCKPDTYNIDPEQVKKAITPKTKAVVAVHLYGQPADMDALREITNAAGIHLVEDCAQAHIAEYKGKKVGGLGDIASYSFYPGKNLGAYGEGGAVTTNDPELAEKVKMLRDHGAHQKYYHESLGHNYRMDGIQGAVLNVKLKYLESWTNCRRNAASAYNEQLKDVEEIITPAESSFAKHVYHLYVIKLKNGDREALAEYLKEKGIATGLHYPVPLHVQKCFENLGYKKGDFPVAEELADTILSLPMYAELTSEQIKNVTDSIKEYFTK
jgi:dTDP-4-amino-4,6-dideoxygalactose transaminase